MSKLLIPARGQAFQRVAQPGGGLVLAPGAKIAAMKYDIKGGCLPYGISTAAGTGDNDINGLYFPGSNNVLFAQSIAANSVAMTRLTGAKGILLSVDNNNGDGQHVSPYYDNGTISSDQEEGVNCFTVGKRAFYMKAAVEVSRITDNDHGDLFIGFAEAAATQDEPNSITEGYGFKIGEDHDDVTTGNIVEQSSTSGTPAFGETSAAMVATVVKVIEVNITAAGVASMKLDGVDATVNSKTFSSGTVLRPLITIVESGAGQTVHLSALEFGFTNARL